MKQTKTNTLQITTPEGIVFSLTLASPIVRFLAYAVDLACISALSSIVGSLVAFFSLLNPDLAGGIMIAAYFFIQIGYGIVLEWLWQGQTLGKRLLRLRVMDVQGMRLHFSQIVIRNLMRTVDSLPLFYLVGGLVCFFNRRAQRLGDIAANTIVIRTTAVVEPDFEQVAAGKFNSLRDYPHLVARLRQRTSSQESDIALRAILRRNNLDASARLHVFSQIASHFKTLIEFPPEATDGLSDEQYVRNVVDVLFRS